MTKEGRKINPLLIVIIILGLMVIALGTSTTILLLKGNKNSGKDCENNKSDPSDLSGDLTVELARKVEKTKGYIFDSDGKIGDYKVNSYPFINIDTYSVNTINQDIERSYLDKIETYNNYAYDYIIHNKYLSVICYYKDDTIPMVDKVYVVDLTSGLEVGNQELLEAYGYKDEELPDKAIDAAFKAFDTEFSNSITKYPKMWESDKNKILFATSDTLNENFYYVDNTGRLFQIYTYAFYDNDGVNGKFKTVNLADLSLGSYEIEK